jgi:hypothetical protein
MRRGMGEYPGYYCYDANRPALLPYWLDDFTESACKWNPSTIAGNIYKCAAGDPTCGTPSGAALDPTLSGPGVAPAGTPTNVPVCGRFSTFNPATGLCEFSVTNPATLLVGAALVAMLFLVRR